MHHFGERFKAVTLGHCLLIAGLCLFVTGVVNAQTPDPSPVDAPQPGVRPALGPFPRFEDWSFLRDPSQRIDPYDRLKFIPLNDSGTTYLTLSVGRQEVSLGTGRLLDNSEGVNVRSAFDGIRLGYDKPKGRIDLIAVKPVETNPGAWDDIPNPAITLWGLYASNVRWNSQFMSDVYFLDYDAKLATYQNQSAREQRRTIGARYFNRPPNEPPTAGFDYNVETGFQWGSFGNRSIRAWGVGANIGWTLPGPVWRARFGFQADALSGDNGQSNTLGTLNAMFPRGAYFGPKFALIGPANLLDLQPQFVFHPLQNVTGTFEWIWFWRESTKDALYTFGNVPLRPANLSDARYVGSQPNLEIRWAIIEHFLAAFNLAGFVPGTFLQQSPPSKDIVFVNVGLTYRF